MFSKHGNFMCLSGGISISENRRENKDVFCVFKSNYTFPEEIGETKQLQTGILEIADGYKETCY